MQLPPSIHLHIEELILHGFAREDRHAIGEAFQNELQRLFTEQGFPSGSREDGSYHVPQLRADNLTVKPGSTPNTIGEQLARSLYATLTPDTSRKKEAQ